jgi:hypothetical protein
MNYLVDRLFIIRVLKEAGKDSLARSELNSLSEQHLQHFKI